MNWDRIEGNWTQWKGKFREKWGDFTDDEWDQIGGRKDQLVGKLQDRYGYAKDEAERMADDFASSLQEDEAMTGGRMESERR